MHPSAARDLDMGWSPFGRSLLLCELITRWVMLALLQRISQQPRLNLLDAFPIARAQARID